MSGIDFAARFGAKNAAASAAPSKSEDKPKSQLWINIGYPTGDPDYPFVSIPVGIPLDGMEPKKIKGSNSDYNQFVAAQNALLEQLLEEAKAVKPGEALEIGLQVQLRRVNDEPAAVPVDETNRFMRPMLTQKSD